MRATPVTFLNITIKGHACGTSGSLIDKVPLPSWLMPSHNLRLISTPFMKCDGWEKDGNEMVPTVNRFSTRLTFLLSAARDKET